MDENSTLTFIRNIRYATKGWVGEFEKHTGVCRGYLARAEQGHIKHMSVSIAMRMAGALGLTVEELSREDFIKNRRIDEIDAEIKALQEERETLAAE